MKYLTIIARDRRFSKESTELFRLDLSVEDILTMTADEFEKETYRRDGNGHEPMGTIHEISDGRVVLNNKDTVELLIAFK